MAKKLRCVCILPGSEQRQLVHYMILPKRKNTIFQALPEIYFKQMKRACRNAQFTNHAFIFIEFQFPCIFIHCQGTCKTDCRTVTAVNTLIFLKVYSLIKRFTYYLLLSKIFNTFFDIFFFTLQFKQQASSFSRVHFCFQDVDTDIVILNKVVTQWFISTFGRKIQYKSFFNHFLPPFPLSY